MQSCVMHGFPPANTGVPVGSQLAVAGMQGWGVNTPSAAAVAAATCGLAKELHNPKGAMLTIGAASVNVATGLPSINTVGAEVATSAEGAAPNVQESMAPLQTN